MKIYLYEGDKSVFLDAFYPGGFGRGIPAINAGQPIPLPSPKPKNNSGKPLPAAVICPGGGYHIIGTTEARPVSDKFTDAGYAAFILHYSVGENAVFGERGWDGFAPARDLKATLSLLHERAEDFGIDAAAIIAAGFSAGGHLCAGSCFSGLLASEGLLPRALVLTYPMGGGEDSGGIGLPQPDFDIARMPYSDDAAVKSLPTFLWHAKDDDMVPFEVSERLAARLDAEGIPHVFLEYEHGVHARPFYDPSWFSRMLDWIASLRSQ